MNSAARGGHSPRAGTVCRGPDVAASSQGRLCLHPMPWSGEPTCTVVPAEGAGGTSPAVGLSSLTLYLVKEPVEETSGRLPGGPVHTREPSGEGLGHRGICASSDQHVEGGGSVHGPGKREHTPGLGSAVSLFIASPKVPRGAHRRPGRPLKPVHFGAESLGGERTEGGLEESQCPCRGATGSRDHVGTPEVDLRVKVHARTQPSGSLQKRVSSRHGPCRGWSYILPCGLTASFHTHRLYFNDNTKK